MSARPQTPEEAAADLASWNNLGKSRTDRDRASRYFAPLTGDGDPKPVRSETCTQEEVWAWSRDYNAWCERRRAKCLATDHQWRAMTSGQAYPASSGRVCMHCDLTNLGWGAAEE